MPLTVLIPTVGAQNATEEPKIASTLTNLATWANGGIPDGDLRSPPNAVRHLLLHSAGTLDDTATAGDKIFTSDSYPLPSGVASYSPPRLWIGDGGLSGQPPDFQVPGKSSVARIRAAIIASLTGAVTLTVGLYQINSVAGTGRALSYVFAAAAPGNAVVAGGLTSGITAIESAEFTLPAVATAFALGVNLSAPLPSGAVVAINAQLYAYNA